MVKPDYARSSPLPPFSAEACIRRLPAQALLTDTGLSPLTEADRAAIRTVAPEYRYFSTPRTRIKGIRRMPPAATILAELDYPPLLRPQVTQVVDAGIESMRSAEALEPFKKRGMEYYASLRVGMFSPTNPYENSRWHPDGTLFTHSVTAEGPSVLISTTPADLRYLNRARPTTLKPISPRNGVAATITGYTNHATPFVETERPRLTFIVFVDPQNG